MNHNLARQRLVLASLTGVLYFSSQGLVGEAEEVEATYEETEGIYTSEVAQDVSELYGEISFAVVDEYTYIWNEASEESDWIGKLYEDNKVTILSIEDTWAKIQSGTVTGYVELEYLLEDADAKIRASELGTTWATVEATALNVRWGPSKDYEIEGVVYNGEQLLVLGEEPNGWQMVQYGEDICYVSGKYVTVEVIYSYAESKEEEEARLQAYEDALVAQETGTQTSTGTSTKSSSEATGTTSIDVSAISGTVDGASVVEFAMQFLGNPYVWGGTDLINGADCSGFVQSVYSYFGISLPRTSSSQRSAGVEVSYDEIQLGDIICYDGHVGIYIGDDQIINAIGTNSGIGISSATYLGIITIRRVI